MVDAIRQKEKLNLITTLEVQPDAQVLQNKPSPKTVAQLKAAMKGLNYIVIIDEAFITILQIRLKGKKLNLICTQASEDKLLKLTHSMRKVHLNTHTIVIGLLSGAGSIGCALAPHFNLVASPKAAETLNNAWMGIRSGFDAVDKKMGEMDQAELTGYQHLTESDRTYKTDIQHSLQEMDAQIAKLRESRDQVADLTNQLMLRIYGSS